MVWFGMAWGLLLPALLGLVLFASAGTRQWPMAWAYLVAYAVVLIAGSYLAIHRDPEFRSERTQAKAGTKAWDKWLSGPLFSLPWLGEYVVAGLDRRYGWSLVSLPVAIAALVLAVLGYSLAVWAMRTNRFYGRFVRIQTERGHTVVDRGPYRFVRHPGYAGVSLFTLASALALQSWWALLPGAMVVATLTVRTALEDRVLREELPGYAEYAQRTRFRLVPGVW